MVYHSGASAVNGGQSDGHRQWCVVGPKSVIAMGVTIGDSVVIGAMSFVNVDIPARKKAGDARLS
jgi:serine acetyltransferase